MVIESLRRRLLDPKYQLNRDDVFAVYRHQQATNPVYREYVYRLKGKDFDPSEIHEIPFLPIQFFKTKVLKSGDWESAKVYKSSATTGMTRSQHHVKDEAVYLQAAVHGFEKQYGSLSQYRLFALLPGYLERGDSSLVAMADHFIKQTEDTASGFYLNDFDALEAAICQARLDGKSSILLGVSHALLAFSERNIQAPDLIVMETGGMKGKGPELPKQAFYERLKKSFGTAQIHAEYGMTELLSQAYSEAAGMFRPNSTMQVLIREVTDPFSYIAYGRSGGINVIDLMNLDTCSFIETQDMGIAQADGTFQVLGRIDASEIRGCNLLVSDL